jgi:excisionase family DNA binding protein
LINREKIDTVGLEKLKENIRQKLKNPKELLLTPSAAAELLSVSPTTIRLWARNGRLTSVKTPGGHRRFNRDEVLSLLSPSSSGVSNMVNILVVEDDKTFGDLLVQIIESYFPYINVSVAYNGFEAGDLLHSLKPDIVILDLVMTGNDGFSICHRIKQTPSTKHIDVIAMTGALTEESVKRITLLGAEACFGKPIDYDLFNETITKMINKNRYRAFSAS